MTRLAVAGLVLAILAPGPALAASFGDDDRRPLPASRGRLADAVGLLSTADGQHACTAICLSPSVILTAAHCLFPSDAQAPPHALTFRVGPQQERRQSPLAASQEGSWLVGSRTLRLKAPINATDDWGFARLAEPACGDHGLPLSERTRAQIIDASLDGRIVSVGFHRDVSLDRLSFEHGCAVDESFPDRGADDAAISRDFAEHAGLLLHRCDTGLGSSGAPLLVEGPAGVEIAGLNIGTYYIARVALAHEGGTPRRIGSDPIANTAVTAKALVAALDRFDGRETLSSGAELISLQQRLAALHLYGGTIDGRSSLALRLAIVAYERMRDIPATGLPTRALLAKLVAEQPGAAR